MNAIAIITPIEGGKWMDRQHILAKYAPDNEHNHGYFSIESVLPAHYGEGIVGRTVDSLLDDPVYTTALVDTDNVYGTFPSMGDPLAWGEDIFLAVADYMSIRIWCEMLGVPVQYPVSCIDVEMSVIQSGREVSLMAAGMLPEGDSIRERIESAVGRHDVAKHMPTHSHL